MYKDHKHKKSAIDDIQSKELRQPKRVDPRALARFLAKPYQLEYQEKMKAGRADEVN